ncbi:MULTISPECIES: DUF4878 domain-containing protein [unclassified Gordonia (in: high G+C Gram-positive bacteria)]
MKLRTSVVAALMAGATVIAVAGCSDSDTVSDATSKASTAIASKASEAAAAVAGLTNSDAQEILRKAVDPNTSATDLETVVDTTNPATKAAIIAYAKGSSMGGYTPDVYTVTSVKKTGDNTADATVEVKSPHTPQPVDITLGYVKVDDTWKLSGDAVTQLSSMMGQHGG